MRKRFRIFTGIKAVLWSGLLAITGLFIRGPVWGGNSATMALKILVDPYEPSKVTDFRAASASVKGEIDLDWTAPGDDGVRGQLKAGAYIIKYDKRSPADFNENTTSWWENAGITLIDNLWIPASPGMKDIKTINAFTADEIYNKETFYFAMRTVDKIGSASAVSDISFATLKGSFTPPATITDLEAAPHITEGTVELKWTAPHDDGTAGGAVSYYIVKYATFGVADFADNTTSWWNNAGVSERVLYSPALPGTRETRVITGLGSGVYYFAIRSVDDREVISVIDTNASLNQAKAPAQAIPPAAINDLVITADYNKVLLSWTAPGDDGWAGTAAKYEIKYATYFINVSNFDDIKEIREINVTVSGGKPDSYVLTGLAGDTLYYIAIKTFDEVDNASNISNVVSTRTLDNVAPSVPTGFSGVGTDHRVDMVWNSNSESDFAGYRIYRSTFSMGYSTAPLVELTANSYADVGLTNGVTLYYVITSFDRKNNESSYSAEAVVMPHDTLPPREPAGIKGTLSSEGRTMTITWSSVTRNADGTMIEDLAGYCIYKAPSLDEIYVLKDFIPAGQTLVWTEPDNVKGHVFYYLIKAQDTSYNRSEMSMIVDCSANTNVISADKADMATYMSIPKKVGSILYAATNSYDDDIRIKVIRSTGDENGRILKSYTFAADKGRTHESVTDISFEKADAEIVLSYKVENGFVKTASQIPEHGASKHLAIFGFNGNEWIKLGGDVDEYAHTVRIKTKRLGKFILKNSLRAVTFTIMAVHPDKIFTPNGDGWNDYFEITYENPADGMVNGKIYDLKGRFVKGMEKGGSAGETAGSIKWDGRDVSGRTAPSGVYLYQIEITGPENKVINGTCVIAK